MVRKEESDLLELDELPDGAVSDREVRQELQRLGDDLLGAAPIFQIRDDLK